MHRIFSQNTYLNLAAGLLAIAAGAKLHTATGEARILAQPDPVLMLSHRTVLVAVGVLELAVAAYLFFGRNLRNKHLLVVWLGVSFLAYRLALAWIAPGKPCPCLGTLTERLPLRPDSVDLLLKLVIVYMLSGSLLFLLLDWARGGDGQRSVAARQSS